MQKYCGSKDKINMLRVEDIKHRLKVTAFARQCDKFNIPMLLRDTLLIEPNAMRQLRYKAKSKSHLNKLTKRGHQPAYNDPTKWPNARYADYHATLYQNTAAGATSSTMDTQTKATALARAFPHKIEDVMITTQDDTSVVVHQALRTPMQDVWSDALTI